MRFVRLSALLGSLPPLSLAGAVLFLAGCTAMPDGFPSIGHVVSSPVESRDVDEAKPLGYGAKTAKSQGAAEAPAAEVAAVPSPKEIFDFHPAGSRADSWRQPFDIDVNDGPLAADVRKTAAELKAYNEQQKAGSAAAAHKACGEMDVAQGKPGCIATKAKSPSTISREPLAPQ